MAKIKYRRIPMHIYKLLHICIILFLAACVVFAEELSEDDNKENLKQLGITFDGPAPSYSQSENSLEIPQGAKVRILDSFDGNIHVNGGSAELPSGYQGKIIVDSGTVKIGDDILFQGIGQGNSYSQSEGFNIKNGIYNGLAIINANSVKSEENSLGAKVIKGITSNVCSPKCMVSDVEFSSNTEFTYSITDNKLKVIGDPSQTTFPNGAIRKVAIEAPESEGIFYYSYFIGDVELDVISSRVYLKKGGSIEFAGQQIIAKYSDVRLFFAPDGSSLKPIKLSSTNSNSVSDLFFDYKGRDNFKTRKELYQNVFNEPYTGTSSQNQRLLSYLNEGVNAPNAPAGIPDSRDSSNPQNPRVTIRSSEGTTAIPGLQPITKGEILAVQKNLEKNDKLLSTIESETEKTKGRISVEDAIAICATESRCNPRAGCYKQSCGVFQVSEDAVCQVYPKECQSPQRRDELWKKAQENPVENTKVGVRYLDYSYKVAERYKDKYNGLENIDTKDLAFMIYNRGQGAVEKIIVKKGEIPDSYTGYQKNVKEFRKGIQIPSNR